MLSVRILVPLFLIVASAGAAQTITVAPSVLVAAGSAEHPLTEPHVAADPAHPGRVLAVAYLAAQPGLAFPAGQDEETCAAFLSLDGGASWARHDFDVTWCADPWAAFTPDGQALVTMLGRHAALGAQGTAGLVAFHSADGGRRWDSIPVGLGAGHDHPTLAVDLSSGKRRGWIYVSSHRGRSADDGHYRYAVYVARSRTGGRSFDDPVWIVPNNLHNLAEMPVVLSDGMLVESFVDATFTPDSGSSPRELLFDRRRAWVVRSTDGAYTFSTPFFVTDACGPPPGYRLSALAADVSGGAFDGRLYFACRAAGGGPIVVTFSRDRGETWAPVRRMQAPARDTVGYPIPGLAVNERGIVLVAWLGTRAPGADPCGSDLYVSASTDGGVAFSRPTHVASCAGGGDYFGVTSEAGGKFRLLWPETRDGVRQLRTTTLEVIR